MLILQKDFDKMLPMSIYKYAGCAIEGHIFLSTIDIFHSFIIFIDPH